MVANSGAVVSVSVPRLAPVSVSLAPAVSVSYSVFPAESAGTAVAALASYDPDNSVPCPSVVLSGSMSRFCCQS